MARVDRDGVPPSREATKFHLIVDGRRYPPKYLISLAGFEATGRELRPDEFSGGGETNAVLQSLGFTIVGPNGATLRSTRQKIPTSAATSKQVRAQPDGAVSIVRVSQTAL